MTTPEGSDEGDALRLLVRDGVVVGPVVFSGVRFWAAIELGGEDDAGEDDVGDDAAARKRAEPGSAALRLLSCLVHDEDPATSMRHASQLAGYAPRSVLIDAAENVSAVLIDAAVLDQGVVLRNEDGLLAVLAEPGPRVDSVGDVAAEGGGEGREDELCEAVHAAWLADRQIEPTRRGGAGRFGGRDAAAVKTTAAASRAELTRAASDLERAQAVMAAELTRRQLALEAEFAAQRAELEAQLAPLREQLARLREVMWTVDLYLGRDETLRLIRDGAPAPAGTAIAIRQRVLVMAEESLALMDRRTTGMTAEDIPEFVAWLLEDPAHLQRVLPEPRGVVVLVATRVESRSGNVFEDAARDAANRSSWWLLRNGERLYLLTVDPELRVTDRVLPRRTEFAEVFDQRLFGVGRRGGESVTPGSEEWLAMEKVADRRRRHYMQILLVLQGIIDRTPVWAPLPPAGVNLLSLADQDAGKIVLLQDDEPSIQLGDGRESFRAWQRRLNGALRPGLRIIGHWGAQGFRDLVDTDWRGRAVHERLSPPSVGSVPSSTVLHLIEDRRDGGFVIRYERTDQVERRGVDVPGQPGYVYRGSMPVTPTRRASCVVRADDGWVLPFDLVTVADLEYYLRSRDDRSSHFLSMVPTIRTALAAKRAEAQTEGPFRELLGRLLVDDGADGADRAGLEALIEDLVHWWKLANTWSRPLNGAPEHEAQAVRDILHEHQARRLLAADDTAADMIRVGRGVAGVFCVARDRRGRWHAYAPSTPAHDIGVFLDITSLGSDGVRGDTRRWQTIPPRSASRLQVVWSSPPWAAWNFAANPRWYLTGPERETLIARVLDRADGLPLCVTEIHDPHDPAVRSLVSYAWTSGTPDDAPIRPTTSPLGTAFDTAREAHGDAGRLITTRVWLVGKTIAGVELIDCARTAVRYPSSFAYYTSGERWGGSPWWPDDAHSYGEARPRLVWSDPALLDRVAGYVARCRAAAAAEQAHRTAREREVDGYVEPVLALIRDQIETAAKTRFVDDFGPGAEDLWPAHLRSLNLTDPVRPHELRDLIRTAIGLGHAVAGQTLGALLDVAGRHHDPTLRRPDAQNNALGDFARIVVPTPPSDDANPAPPPPFGGWL